MKRLIIVTLVSLSLWALAACSVSFNIHFDSNGGSDVASIETSGTGTIRLPNDPVKEGYVFDGWYWDNNTFQQPFTANSLLDAPLSNNLTVYARWRNPLEDSNTGLLRVRFMNAGDVSVEPVFVQPGSAITPPLVSKEGHTLRGWYTSINQGQTLDERWSFSTNLVNSNIDLYPDWEVNQYTITLDTSGGDGQTSVQQDFDSIIIIDDPMKEGHTFIGWSPELPEKMPSRSLAVTAQWVINQYTISFDSDGVVSLAAITQDFNSDIDEPVVLERIGYEFLGWFLDENADSPFIFDKVPARDINLKARWEAIEFTINYELDGGENTSNPNTRTIETPEIVLEDPIKEGHTFIGWFDNEDLTGTAITVISQGFLEDIVLHAKWERIPTTPTISGVDSITVMVGDEFDPLAGVSASDEIDGSLTSSITVSGEVDTATGGTYTLKYRVENAAGLSREVSRKVIVHNDMDTDDSESDDVEDSDSNDGEQEELLLTLQELSEFDGRNGRRALIAVDGIIYEVTGSPRWPNGNHNGYQAGQDLTQQIDTLSPHGRRTLDRMPRVGRIIDDTLNNEQSEEDLNSTNNFDVSDSFSNYDYRMHLGEVFTPDDAFIRFFNNYSVDIQVEITAVGPPGVDFLLESTLVDIPARTNIEIPIWIAVDENAEPGEYILGLAARVIPAATGGIQVVGAAELRTRLFIFGEGFEEFTLETLAEFDGRNGRNAYIAVDGIVYDVTNSPRWPNGNHNGYQAGQDLTQFIDQISPHGRLVLDRLPRVGRIFDDAQGK